MISLNQQRFSCKLITAFTLHAFMELNVVGADSLHATTVL